MAITTLSDISTYTNQINTDVEFVFRETALMPQLVTRVSASGYMPRNVTVWGATSARDVADGEDFVTNDKLDRTLLSTLTPKSVAAQYILTDQMVQTDPNGALNAAAVELGAAVTEKVDKDLLGIFSTFSEGKGTANNALTLALCAAALSVTRNNGGRGQAFFVLHPYGWHDIWTEIGKPSTNLVASDLANEALRQYYVGNMLGAQWFTSSNIAVDAADDAYGAVFTRDALALDTREAMSVRPQRDESRAAVELNARMGYAVGKWRGDRGAHLLHDATEPA
jgi:hypothetical protein